jgi:hypothetical protein
MEHAEVSTTKWGSFHAQLSIVHAPCFPVHPQVIEDEHRHRLQRRQPVVAGTGGRGGWAIGWSHAATAMHQRRHPHRRCVRDAWGKNGTKTIF